MPDEPSLSRPRGRRTLFMLLPSLAFASVATVALALPPVAEDVGEIAVVFPPFTGEASAWASIVDAGGYLVGPTRLPNVFVAYADDPDFKARMRDAGAWLFFKAEGLCAETDDL